jgi:drug/metabolite transporter (DMT)-like permease
MNTPNRRERWPALEGALLALLAAACFGVSTPLVQRAGAGLGPFTTAALLYAGAACVGALMRRPAGQEARLQRGDWRWLAGMALFGAAIGPVALAWGLQHTSGTSASLMLTLEALFTAVLARVLYHEVMDARVWLAMTLLFAGAVVLVVDRGLHGGTQWWGLAAVMLATAAWGVDNGLSRAVADRDPGSVVLAKSSLGVACTLGLAAFASEPWPPIAAMLALLAIGATGYGLSLRLYLLAQRTFGAARTGSVFAFAPFIGALLALTMGDRSLSAGMATGGALMLAGVALHLAESHAHPHTHEALEHEHAHRHDDGHHDHDHLPMPTGTHSHPHRHAPMTHAHAHVPDAHHLHVHDHD